MGSVDGFVNLTFQGEAFQTSVQKNTYSPVWGETFTVQVARIQDAGELELALWDWNATTADKFVAQVRISAPEMVAILRGTPGKKILRREELLDKESQVVVGRDGQPAEIFLSLRPFVRITSTESFRRGLECAELSLTKDKLDKQKGVAETHGERCDVSHLVCVRERPSVQCHVTHDSPSYFAICILFLDLSTKCRDMYASEGRRILRLSSASSYLIRDVSNITRRKPTCRRTSHLSVRCLAMD